jgi:hypothetical protein
VEAGCERQNSIGPAPAKPKTSFTDWFYGLFRQPEIVPFLKQSGLQAALGQCSWAAELEKAEEFKFTENEEIKRKEGKQKLDAALKGSPLMILYPVLLAFGVICGLVLPLKKPRQIILMACSGSALILLILQTAIGFPIQDALAIVDPGVPWPLRYTYWYGLSLLAGGVSLLIAALEWHYQFGFIRDPKRFSLSE